MKSRPTKPFRTKVTHKVDVYDGISLQCMVEKIGEGVDFSKVHIVKEGYYEDQEVYLEYTLAETDEEFAKRIKKYNDSLKKYNQWYTENKTDIDLVLANRATAKKIKSEKDLSRLLKEKTKLESQIAKLTT